MDLYVKIKEKIGTFTLDVEFTVKEGECLGLIGRSGSGKSMSLKSIAGIKRPDEGVIRLGDKYLFNSEKKIDIAARARNFGYLFQSYALFSKMSVKENIKIGIKTKDKKDREREVEEVLTLFQIAELVNRYPHELSGGQQQRVALARMLASKPAIMMLDEPFSALDQELKDQIDDNLLSILRTFCGPVLFVSHNKEEVNRYCTRTLTLESGRIIT